MSSENPCEVAAAAQACLAGVRQLLLQPSPRNLEQCLPQLGSAIRHLEELRATLGGPNGSSAPLRQEFSHLSRELAGVVALLHHAGRFHLGWASFLAPAASEYGLTGTVFPTPPANRVAFDG